MKKNSKKEIFKTIKSRIFDDFHVKIICILLAIGMYFAINILKRSEKTYTVGLQITGLSDYFIISNEIPDTVKVIARERDDLLDKITERDFNVTLDLSFIESPGSYPVKLDWNIDEKMSSFFSTITLDPEKIDIVVENLIEKNIPIRVNQIGSVEFGHQIKSISINPVSIRARGPESLMKDTEYIDTESIFIEGETDSFKRFVDLIPPSNLIEVIGKTRVEVYFQIIEETENSTFTFYSVNVRNIKSQFSVIQEKRPIVVTVKGSKAAVETLNSRDVRLHIDCSDIIFPGNYSEKIEVTVPPEFDIVTIRPEYINIQVTDK